MKDEFSDNKDQFTWSAHTTLLIDKPDKILISALPIVLIEKFSYVPELIIAGMKGK